MGRSGRSAAALAAPVRAPQRSGGPGGQAPGRALPRVAAGPGRRRRGAHPAAAGARPLRHRERGVLPDPAHGQRPAGAVRGALPGGQRRPVEHPHQLVRAAQAGRARGQPARPPLPARRRAGLRHRRAHPVARRPLRRGDGERLHPGRRRGDPRGHRRAGRGHGGGAGAARPAGGARGRGPRGVQRGALLPGRGRSRRRRRADRPGRPPGCGHRAAALERAGRGVPAGRLGHPPGLPRRPAVHAPSSSTSTPSSCCTSCGAGERLADRRGRDRGPRSGRAAADRPLPACAAHRHRRPAPDRRGGRLRGRRPLRGRDGAGRPPVLGPPTRAGAGGQRGRADRRAGP